MPTSGHLDASGERGVGRLVRWAGRHPWVWLGLYLMVTAGLYQLAIRAPWCRGIAIEPTALDALIPQWPWMAAPYLSYFALMPTWVWLVRRRDDAGRLLVAAGLCVVGNLALNLLVPTYVSPAPTAPPGEPLLALVIGHDRPYAAAPSGHLALPLALAWLAAVTKVEHGWLFVPWTLVLGVAILTTKQHYLPDALAAILWGSVAPRLALALTRPAAHTGQSAPVKGFVDSDGPG